MRHVLIFICIATVSGCTGWRESLWERNAPDEFFHTPLPPLVIPPRLDERAPAQKTPAQTLQVVEHTDLSEAERIFLERAGLALTVEDVRSVIDQEISSLDTPSPALVEELETAILDPMEEAQRLAREEQPVIYIKDVVSIRP